MTADDLRAIQAPLKQRYREDPEAARKTITVRGVLRPEHAACRIDARPRTADGTPADAGLHPAAGGDGSWACSGDMLLESLAACAGVTLCAVATALDVPLQGGAVEAAGVLDFRGTLGVDRDAPVGFETIRLQFELDTTADAALLEKLAGLTERYCVVARSLSTPIVVSVLSQSEQPVEKGR